MIVKITKTILKARVKERRFYLSFRTYSNENEKALSYFHNACKEPLQYTTLGKVLESSARKWPEKIAIKSLEENVTLSYYDFLRKADEMASALQEVGLQRGDRIGLWAPNSWIWQVVNLAASRAGFMLVAINPLYQKVELQKCINKVGIKALVSLQAHKEQDFYAILRELAPELATCEAGRLISKSLPTLRTVLISSEDECRGAFNFKTLAARASDQSIKRLASEQHLIQADDPCCIMFTSGTTGDPKAIIQSHMSIVNASILVGKRQQYVEGQETIGIQLPMFHIFAYCYAAIAGFINGATIVLPSIRYSPSATYDAVVSEKCSVLHGSPTMFVDLMTAANVRGVEGLRSLHTIVSGGAYIPQNLLKGIKYKLGLTKSMVVLGMTETPTVFALSDNDKGGETAYHTLGHSMDHLEVKVIDNDGRVVPRGEVGELCVRGYSIMQGYWEDEEKTKEVLSTDGWLHTGDLVLMLSDGRTIIVSRIKEVINRGGEKIFPKEIEDVIVTLDSVIEVQVFAMADERLGQEVGAAVRVKPGVTLTLEELKGYCKHKMADYKIPKKLWVVKEFPKNETGKIQKKNLGAIFT